MALWGGNLAMARDLTLDAAVAAVTAVDQEAHRIARELLAQADALDPGGLRQTAEILDKFAADLAATRNRDRPAAD